MLSFLLYILEDNRQPLVCAFKHDNKTILDGEKRNFSTAKIVLSLAALFAGVGAAVILLYGHCKNKKQEN